MFGKVYNKRVLITGHTGFKGSWLAIWLKQLGADVVGYSRSAQRAQQFEATGLRDKITHIHGDIRDLDRLMGTFKNISLNLSFTCSSALVRLS